MNIGKRVTPVIHESDVNSRFIWLWEMWIASISSILSELVSNETVAHTYLIDIASDNFTILKIIFIFDHVMIYLDHIMICNSKILKDFFMRFVIEISSQNDVFLIDTNRCKSIYFLVTKIMFEIILMKQKIKWRSKVRSVTLNVYSFFLKILREKNRVMTGKYQKNIAHYHLMYWIYQIFFCF